MRLGLAWPRVTLAPEIRNPYQPAEIGALVPPPPTKMMDIRPGRARVVQSADIFVDRHQGVYCSDTNAGLYNMDDRMMVCGNPRGLSRCPFDELKSNVGAQVDFLIVEPSENRTASQNADFVSIRQQRG
jgi:hypothetical protein